MKIIKIMVLFGFIAQFGSSYAQALKQASTTTIIIKPNQHVIIQDKSGKILSESHFSTNGFDYAKAVTFMQKIIKKINQNNINSLAKHIDYPARMGRLKINNKKEFKATYSKIFTPEFKKQINTLNPYALFARYNGVMLGSGQIWINYCRNKNVFCVISINT